ncbi:hypothetical protein BST63_33270 [Bradyrhizobium canariense]|uniref:Uncharacterized protein n=1 Tax=Bradyrhizobium canariense TaxID=255045 RepID=A0ABX3WTG6_9BRAD|nr:hypothetical protein BSR47_27110 [Bradyrhizobium canariense]OSJ21821.1 hypothetical protein BST63_33270 [Bradyrhizobium canariense]
MQFEQEPLLHCCGHLIPGVLAEGDCVFYGALRAVQEFLSFRAEWSLHERHSGLRRERCGVSQSTDALKSWPVMGPNVAHAKRVLNRSVHFAAEFLGQRPLVVKVFLDDLRGRSPRWTSS